MPQDLHTFLRDYGTLYPDEILTIDSPVDYRYEATALVTKLEREKRFPVVMFLRRRRERRAACA